MADLLLDALSLGDVAEADDRADDRAVLLDRPGAVFDGDARAVLPKEVLVVDAARLAPRVGREHRALFPGVLAAVGPVVVEQAVRRGTRELVRREAEDPAGGVVDEVDPALRVHPEDPVRGRLQDEARPLLRGLQLLLLRNELFLGFAQGDGLLLELPRLLLRPLQELAGREVPREDLEARRHDRQELLEERRLARTPGAERGDLEDAQDHVPGDHRPGGRANGSGAAEAGGDPEVARGQVFERDRGLLPRALADEALPRPERLPDRPAVAEAEGGDPAKETRVLLVQVERGHAAPEERHEPRDEPLPELGERIGLLHLAGQPRHSRLDPALVLHRRRAALQDVDRPGEGAGLVRGARERHGPRVVPGGDRLDRLLQRADRRGDPPERQDSHDGGEEQAEGGGDEEPPSRRLDGLSGQAAGALGLLLVVTDPLGRDRAQPLADLRVTPAQLRDGLLDPARDREGHEPLGAGGPLAAQPPVLVVEPPVPVPRDGRVSVALEEGGHLLLRLGEGGDGRGPLLRGPGEKAAPHEDPPLRESAGDVPDELEALGLLLRHDQGLRPRWRPAGARGRTRSRRARGAERPAG